MKRIPISKAKALAAELGVSGVAIFAFGDDQVAGTSYGADKALCDRMGQFLDRVIDDLEAGEIDNPLDDGACPWPAVRQE